MVSIFLILKSYSKIESIVPVSEGYSDPDESSFRVRHSDGIASAAIVCFLDGLPVILRDVGFTKEFLVFIDEGYLDDFILFGHPDSTLPNHLFPVIQVVAFGGGERWDLEDGDSFSLVAEH